MLADFETKQHEIEAKAFQKEAVFNKKMNYVYIVVSLFILLTLFYFVKSSKQKVKLLKYEQKSLIQQKEKQQLEKQNLELELDKKHREVLAHVMQINQQKETLTSVFDEVKTIISLRGPEEKDEYARQLMTEIKSKINLNDDWNQIKFHFEKIHPDFFTNLKNEFPMLSLNDLRLIAYTKLKLSPKEISRLMNTNVGSIQVARYRLKKKMNVPETESIVDYIIAR